MGIKRLVVQPSTKGKSWSGIAYDTSRCLFAVEMKLFINRLHFVLDVAASISRDGWLQKMLFRNPHHEGPEALMASSSVRQRRQNDFSLGRRLFGERFGDSAQQKYKQEWHRQRHISRSTRGDEKKYTKWSQRSEVSFAAALRRGELIHQPKKNKK